MRNPEKMLSSLAKHSVQQEYKYERLYRLLYNQEMYLKAYQKIYAKPGNLTKGDKATYHIKLSTASKTVSLKISCSKTGVIS